MQTPNEVIDLAEKHSQEVARFSLAGLDEARRRAHALLVLLLAGGGTLGGLGLARADALAHWPLAAAALAGAMHCFGLAAYVAWQASTTAAVRSWATPGLAVGGYGKWLAYAQAANTEPAGWMRCKSCAWRPCATASRPRTNTALHPARRTPW